MDEKNGLCRFAPGNSRAGRCGLLHRDHGKSFAPDQGRCRTKAWADARDPRPACLPEKGPVRDAGVMELGRGKPGQASRRVPVALCKAKCGDLLRALPRGSSLDEARYLGVRPPSMTPFMRCEKPKQAILPALNERQQRLSRRFRAAIRN